MTDFCLDMEGERIGKYKIYLNAFQVLVEMDVWFKRCEVGEGFERYRGLPSGTY